jgi:hypothetical protein
MKLKLTTTTLLFAIIILLNVFFIYNRISFARQANHEIKEQEQFYENKLQIIDELRKIEIAHEFSPLAENGKVQLPSNEMLPLKSIVENSNKLFFCIPEGVCNVCYDSLYATFNVMADDIGAKNIVILVPSNRLREMSLLFEGKSLSKQIFGVSSKQLGLTIHGAYLPYFFVMDAAMVARNLHLPHKNDQSLTNFYLASVKKRYFYPDKNAISINH